MKTTFTIAAIAMFAVVLGMGTFAPAMAAPNDNASDKAKAGKISICHVELDDPETPDVDESSVELITVSANSAHNNSDKHPDDYEPFTDENGELTCDVPEPTEPEVPIPEETA